MADYEKGKPNSYVERDGIRYQYDSKGNLDHVKMGVTAGNSGYSTSQNFGSPSSSGTSPSSSGTGGHRGITNDNFGSQLSSGHSSLLPPVNYETNMVDLPQFSAPNPYTFSSSGGYTRQHKKIKEYMAKLRSYFTREELNAIVRKYDDILHPSNTAGWIKALEDERKEKFDKFEREKRIREEEEARKKELDRQADEKLWKNANIDKKLDIRNSYSWFLPQNKAKLNELLKKRKMTVEQFKSLLRLELGFKGNSQENNIINEVIEWDKAQKEEEEEKLWKDDPVQEKRIINLFSWFLPENGAELNEQLKKRNISMDEFKRIMKNNDPEQQVKIRSYHSWFLPQNKAELNELLKKRKMTVEQFKSLLRTKFGFEGDIQEDDIINDLKKWDHGQKIKERGKATPTPSPKPSPTENLENQIANLEEYFNPQTREQLRDRARQQKITPGPNADWKKFLEDEIIKQEEDKKNAPPQNLQTQSLIEELQKEKEKIEQKNKEQQTAKKFASPENYSEFDTDDESQDFKDLRDYSKIHGPLSKILAGSAFYKNKETPAKFEGGLDAENLEKLRINPAYIEKKGGFLSQEDAKKAQQGLELLDDADIKRQMEALNIKIPQEKIDEIKGILSANALPSIKHGASVNVPLYVQANLPNDAYLKAMAGLEFGDDGVKVGKSHVGIKFGKKFGPSRKDFSKSYSNRPIREIEQKHDKNLSGLAAPKFQDPTTISKLYTPLEDIKKEVVEKHVKELNAEKEKEKEFPDDNSFGRVGTMPEPENYSSEFPKKSFVNSDIPMFDFTQSSPYNFHGYSSKKDLDNFENRRLETAIKQDIRHKSETRELVNPLSVHARSYMSGLQKKGTPAPTAALKGSGKKSARSVLLNFIERYMKQKFGKNADDNFMFGYRPKDYSQSRIPELIRDQRLKIRNFL